MQMATVEIDTAGTEGDQKEKMSPSQEDSPPVLNDTSAPLNFSELTPCQFGISVQSFTPASLSNRKGERDWSEFDAKLLLHLQYIAFYREKCLHCVDSAVLSHHW